MNRYPSNNRDHDPKYKSWAWSCKALWNFTCALCGQRGGNLEAHHIVKWASWPKGRYLLSNAACLCKQCHKIVTGREEDYEDYFRKIVREKLKEKKRVDKKFQNKKRTKKRRVKNNISKKLGYKKPKRFLRGPRSRY